jgi:hypothetical protein
MYGTCIKITVHVFYNRPVETLEFHQKTQFLLPGSQKVQSIYWAKELAPLVAS